MSSGGFSISQLLNSSSSSHVGQPPPENNLSNTSMQTPAGISGRLVYTEYKGNNYIRFVNDNDGELIARLRRDHLIFCQISKI